MNEDQDRKAAVKELKALFKETQALPQAQALTQEEILAEIEAYRRGDEDHHRHKRFDICCIERSCF